MARKAGVWGGGRRRLLSWAPLAAALAGGGAVALAVRGARRRKRADPFADYVTRFWLSHEALRRNLGRLVDLVDRDERFDLQAFADYVSLYGRFLVVHHESEDRIVFPTLRRHGRLKSTDAAHLDRWGAEHHDVNAAGDALVTAGQRVRDGGRARLGDLRKCCQDLQQLLAPHLTSEEELFTPQHLAEMIPPEAIRDIDRQGRKLFGEEREIPLFFAHSLQPAEQKQVFAAAPWIFRRVIFPLIDRRAFPRFAPFVISSALDA